LFVGQTRNVLPLHGALMKISIRIEDGMAARIDQAASAKGVTRSRWISALIEQELGLQPEQGRRRRKASGLPRQVHLRLDATEVELMEEVAATFGMTRNQWIVSVLRSRVMDSEGRIIVSPISKYAIRDMIGQIVRIGRNVDQAVHALNASAMQGSRLNPSSIAAQLVAMGSDVRDVCDESRRALLDHLNAEKPYWRQH
jgi:uncharacterized protein (DUF1778 family)